MAADGFANTRIAAEVQVSPVTVTSWRDRFEETGLKDLSAVRAGRRRKPSIPQAKVEEIVRLTLTETPPGEAHWSCRSMAERAGVSSSTVQRICAARGPQPHRVKVHLILDNYATHNHPKVRAWLERHPRFELHFTPTSSSWLNMVELFFGKLTDKPIRRGLRLLSRNLIDAIENYLAAHNQDPKPFIWTATTDQILEKVRRGRVTLDAIAS